MTTVGVVASRAVQRRTGAATGLLVAALFTAVGLSLLAFLGVRPLDAFVVLGVPTLATGAVVGWLFGPRASRAASWRDRTFTSLGMACVATAIGDYFVGVAMGSTANENVAVAVVQAALSALVLWPIGLLFFGLIAVPMTFAAALLWTWLIARLATSGLIRSAAAGSTRRAPLPGR